MRQLACVILMLGAIGCVTDQPMARHTSAEPATVVERVDAPADAARIAAAMRRPSPPGAPAGSPSRGARDALSSAGPASDVRRVSHRSACEPDFGPDSVAGGTIAIDGRRYRVAILEEITDETSNPAAATVATPQPESQDRRSDTPIDLNLPTALSMIGGRHPAVGFARWRVQEAYAQLDQAEALWLPSLRAGLSFHRHDGNYQASDGSIIDVNRNSFQFGLGAGATGAGTTPRPGLVAEFHLADAIFRPEVARNTAWARGHAANGVLNDQLRDAALAYLELLEAHQEARILEASRDRTAALSKLTGDFAAAGQGLQADADRMETELMLVASRLAIARERIGVASARLAQTLSIAADRPIAPLDPTVVPIDLVSLNQDQAALISTGLANRPELRESQALVAAACEEYRRQAAAPFVPSVLLGFSTGGFGGGLGNRLDRVDDRYDFDALMAWEIRNLGFGERAARRAAESRIQQARFEKIRVMDQVAREISEAVAQAQAGARRMDVTRQSIQTAESAFERDLVRIRDGQGLPLEALQSLRSLEDARLALLTAVMDYNASQFQLQWALGWPVAMPVRSEPQPPAPAPPEVPAPIPQPP